MTLDKDQDKNSHLRVSKGLNAIAKVPKSQAHLTIKRNISSLCGQKSKCDTVGKELQSQSSTDPVTLKNSVKGPSEATASAIVSSPDVPEAKESIASCLAEKVISDAVQSKTSFRMLSRMVSPPENESLEEAILRRRKRFGVPMEKEVWGAEARSTNTNRRETGTLGIWYRSMAEANRESEVKAGAIRGKGKFGKNFERKGKASKGIGNRNNRRYEKSKAAAAKGVAKEELQTRGSQRSVYFEHRRRGRKFRGNRRCENGVTSRDEGHRRGDLSGERRDTNVFRHKNNVFRGRGGQMRRGSRYFSYKQSCEPPVGNDHGQGESRGTKRLAEGSASVDRLQSGKRARPVENEEQSEVVRRRIERFSKGMPPPSERRASRNNCSGRTES